MTELLTPGGSRRAEASAGDETIPVTPGATTRADGAGDGKVRRGSPPRAASTPPHNSPSVRPSYPRPSTHLDSPRAPPPRRRPEQSSSFMVCGNLFEVDAKYVPIKPIGKGAYGLVCSAKNAARPGEKVAIKKITNAFENAIDAKRTLREIKLLRHLKHENVIRITDVSDPPPLETFNDVYVFYELMDTDLHQARSIHWSPYDPVGVVNAVP